MKNFSDLLATDLHLDLVLIAEPVGIPDVEIWINQQLIQQGLISAPVAVSTQLPLLSGFSIMVKLKNKVYTAESETAVMLTKLSIDGFDIIPQFTHLAQYTNDHAFTEPTAYIGFNGEWRLEVTNPFYQWHHEITSQGWLFQPCKLPTQVGEKSQLLL
jgi:hypothetical protein